MNNSDSTNLQQRMKNAGLNITEVARRARIDRSTTSKVLSGYFERKIAEAIDGDAR